MGSAIGEGPVIRLVCREASVSCQSDIKSLSFIK